MIPKIKDMVRTDKDLSQAIDEISECIIASLFYFELDSIPKQRNGEYSGSGCILCLRRRSDPALVALIDKLSRSSARFLVCGVEIPGSVRDPPFWDGNGNFRKNITFKVKGEFMISLKDARGREYPISGAPFSVEKLVAAQGLNAYFGTSDHKRKSELVNEDWTLDDSTLQGLEQELPDMLKTFALKMGHSGSAPEDREIMYFVYKHQE
ncbi:hypothetical protein GE09DRAFT_1272225 [Coniochaeta sp. 2T2.1]|nr:hypothetical protein GE09DRAFT_1272225 [Coniochaeta sp. 2T2.1]